MKRWLAPLVVGMLVIPIGLSGSTKTALATGPALVQVTAVHTVGTGNGNGGTTNAVTLSTTTAGDFLAVGYQFIAGASGATGSVNQSFTKAIEKTQPNGGTQASGLWYRANIPGGAITVTLTTTLAADSAIVLLEYSGVATASP